MSSSQKTSLFNPIALTPGEPAGIGPDIVLTLAAKGLTEPVVAVANKSMLEDRARALKLEIKFHSWEPGEVIEPRTGELHVLDQKLGEEVVPGLLNPMNAQYVLNCLDSAIDGALEGYFSAVVTGPAHKGVINDAGIPFTGHTEHFQMRCKVERVVMMLASSRMRVALVTTHLPLKDVSSAITKATLKSVLDILISDLRQKFGVDHPRILVAGLNPHAGEGGHMGTEEIDTIKPVMDLFSDDAVSLLGPLPADTLFTPKYLNEADAVLAMFHDQGLPVLKYDGFGEAINITLGLPIIRTSVDHGTALDIAATGSADGGSLQSALTLASAMAHSAN